MSPLVCIACKGPLGLGGVTGNIQLHVFCAACWDKVPAPDRIKFWNHYDKTRKTPRAWTPMALRIAREINGEPPPGPGAKIVHSPVPPP